MSRSTSSRLALTVLTASTLACHAMYFDISYLPIAQIDPPIVERESHWVFGIFPEVVVDVRSKCPNGAVAIREELRPSDYLLGVLTLAIYTPRTSEYFCRSEPYVVPQPPPPG